MCDYLNSKTLRPQLSFSILKLLQRKAILKYDRKYIVHGFIIK